MKIGLISDTHGDVAAWHLAVELFRDCDYILHSGDILYNGAFNPVGKNYNPLDLASHINNCPIPVIFAKGNCDSEVDTLAIEYPIQAPYAFANLLEKKILIHHGDKLTQEKVLEMSKKFPLDVVVSGHTHIYKINKTASTIFVNPGSASLPKDPDSIKSAALMDEEGIKIIALESNKTLTSINF
ncbi:MAG: phosphodiesterase [Actinobacteria bacterium]|nr:MAG: phosphodiesterase [Actinomycetota bacterium]